MKTEREIVIDFLKEQHLAVVSTVTSDHLPSSAVVGVMVNDNLEVFFCTYKSSRKCENIRKNPRVSLVIGWDKGRTVQYEGEAIEMNEEEYVKEELTKLPSAAKFLSKSEAVFYKVTPKWVRYTDLSKDPWDIIEA
jgi:general stress protein 26